MNYGQKTEKLNELRKQLEDLISDYSCLTDPEVIRASKKLDDLIYKHHKSRVKIKLTDERNS